MRIIHTVFVVVVLFCNNVFAQKILSAEIYKNINLSKSTGLDVNLSIQEKWLILKLSNIESTEIDSEVIYNFKNELIYKDKKQNLFWTIGLSENQFRKELSVLDKQKTSFNYNLYYLLNHKAFAGSQICKEAGFHSNFKELNEGIQRVDFSQIISKCNFSITELFKKKIDELKETLIKIGQFNFSEFVSTVKQAFNALIETIPHISTKIIQPLTDLVKAAPKVAENIVCSFTENKIGDIFQAAVVGPAGFSRLALKTAEDIGKLSHRIYVLTKNGAVSKYLIDLHKMEKLTKKDFERIEQILPDVPDVFKRKVFGFSSEEKFREHAEKHMKEFGLKNAAEYLEAAKQFAKSNSPDVIAIQRSSGNYIKWNTKTDEFLTTGKDGTIATYFKIKCAHPAEKLSEFLYDGNLNEKTVCKEF